jgi:hypothetical protein
MVSYNMIHSSVTGEAASLIFEIIKIVELMKIRFNVIFFAWAVVASRAFGVYVKARVST